MTLLCILMCNPGPPAPQTRPTSPATRSRCRTSPRAWCPTPLAWSTSTRMRRRRCAATPSARRPRAGTPAPPSSQYPSPRPSGSRGSLRPRTRTLSSPPRITRVQSALTGKSSRIFYLCNQPCPCFSLCMGQDFLRSYTSLLRLPYFQTESLEWRLLWLVQLSTLALGNEIRWISNSEPIRSILNHYWRRYPHTSALEWSNLNVIVCR